MSLVGFFVHKTNHIIHSFYSNHFSYLPIGCDTIAIELYDDCLFTQDELIAWATYKVPENFLRFTSETPEHTFEERIVLSGKQGEGLEGELFISVNSKVTNFFSILHSSLLFNLVIHSLI